MDSLNGYTPNEWLVEQAKEAGVNKKDLLVLAPNNDPFNAGTHSHLEQAVWFAKVFKQVGYPDIHLRRLHYRAFDAGVLDLRGERYENTEKHWKDLQDASRYARYLEQVDPADFRDNRAPNPLLSVYGLPYTPGPKYELEVDTGPLDWYLPRISTVLQGRANPSVGYEVSGYDYSEDLQPLLVELWTEKSGDNATLRPLAARYGINYCPGIGFQSVTNIRKMFSRVRRTGKPARILYISDFDPAGMGMPVQVGRQTQFAFWQLEKIAEEEAGEAEVKLEPIALTYEQVTEWQIPRKPIKDEDLRKGTWEDRFGEGAVEVDALEARHPGRLRELVSERVEELQDPDLREEIEEAREEAEESIRLAINEVTQRHRESAEATVAEFNEVAERYRERLKVISEELEQEVAPIRERFAEQKREFEEEVESLEVDIPELPEGVVLETDRDWMFDSTRDFLEQTQEFRRRQRR